MKNEFIIQGILQDKVHFPSKPLEKDGEPVIGKDGEIVMKKEFYMLKVAIMGDTMTFFVSPEKAILCDPNNSYFFIGFVNSKGLQVSQIKPVLTK